MDGTKELLKNKFDYIFATGSTSMGRHVMAAAAPHLTPLTLELGGKSPIYIDDSSDFELAAKRIMWGKCVNLGQTCVAPDYIMCSKKVEQAFLKVALRVLNEWYGTHWKDSKDLTRIINERHFLRLRELIENTEGLSHRQLIFIKTFFMDLCSLFRANSIWRSNGSKFTLDFSHDYC